LIHYPDNGLKPREIGKGYPFKDSEGHSQVFGRFGRDIPEHSNGNCYREDAIPGRPALHGIVDLPHYPADQATTDALYNQFNHLLGGTVRIRISHIKVRVVWDVISILWCQAPGQRHILGYYKWSAYQVWDFHRRPNEAKGTTSLIGSAVTWHLGADGLETEMKSSR